MGTSKIHSIPKVQSRIDLPIEPDKPEIPERIRIFAGRYHSRLMVGFLLATVIIGSYRPTDIMSTSICLGIGLTLAIFWFPIRKWLPFAFKEVREAKREYTNDHQRWSMSVEQIIGSANACVRRQRFPFDKIESREGSQRYPWRVYWLDENGEQCDLFTVLYRRRGDEELVYFPDAHYEQRDGPYAEYIRGDKATVLSPYFKARS